jgi:hypothetical protein
MKTNNSNTPVTRKDINDIILRESAKMGYPNRKLTADEYIKVLQIAQKEMNEQDEDIPVTHTVNVSERTKGTWKSDKQLVIDATGDKNIAFCGYGTVAEAEANAAFICKAVNNYDALVEALKNITYEYKMRMIQSAALGNWQYKEDSTLTEAKEAINKATL